MSAWVNVYIYIYTYRDVHRRDSSYSIMSRWDRLAQSEKVGIWRVCWIPDINYWDNLMGHQGIVFT
jgi:hypothetical protein